VHCNTGSTQTDLISELGSMTVHHNPKSIANVLSLKSVALRHHTTYDSKHRGGVFKVYTPGGVVEFKPSERGLYYLDMGELAKLFGPNLPNLRGSWLGIPTGIP